MVMDRGKTIHSEVLCDLEFLSLSKPAVVLLVLQCYRGAADRQLQQDDSQMQR